MSDCGDDGTKDTVFGVATCPDDGNEEEDKGVTTVKGAEDDAELDNSEDGVTISVDEETEDRIAGTGVSDGKEERIIVVDNSVGVSGIWNREIEDVVEPGRGVSMCVAGPSGIATDDTEGEGSN